MTDPLDLAEKIAKKANDTLQPLATEMAANAWPADFRQIMWQAVADTAARLAKEP